MKQTTKQKLLDANFKVIESNMIGFEVFNIGNLYGETADLFRVDIICDSKHFRDMYYLVYFEGELIGYGNCFAEKHAVHYNTYFINLEWERKIHIMYEQMVERDEIEHDDSFIDNVLHMLKYEKTMKEISELNIEDREPKDLVKVIYKKHPDWNMFYAKNQVHNGFFLLYAQYQDDQPPFKYGWRMRHEIKIG